MEATAAESRATFPATVDVHFHNVCSSCGAESRSVHRMETWLSALIGKTETSNLCERCAAEKKREFERLDAEARMDELIRNSEIPDEFRKWDCEKGNKSLANAIRENREKNLFICGYYGTGKTRAACINLLRKIKLGSSGRFVRFSAIASQYQKTFSNGEMASEKFVKGLLHTATLLIDDIGKRRITQTAGELLYEILDRVYAGDSKCKLWITSNAMLGELESKFDNSDIGAAVVSRIDRLVTDGKMVIVKTGA